MAVTRPIVQKYADEAGVPAEILTTMADIYSGPTGLPDEEPYNETVMLAPGVDRKSPDAVKWEAYLWRCAHGDSRPNTALETFKRNRTR